MYNSIDFWVAFHGDVFTEKVCEETLREGHNEFGSVGKILEIDNLSDNKDHDDDCIQGGRWSEWEETPINVDCGNIGSLQRLYFDIGVLS